MHNFNRGLAQRVERLEREIAGLPIPPTLEEQYHQDARRLELVSAVLNGEVLGDLTEEERTVFEAALRYVPVFRELIEEGVLVGYYHDADEEEAIWRP